MEPEILKGLRTALADLYFDEASIRRIATDSRIDLARVNLNNTAINNWHSVLMEAEKIGRVKVLLNIVESEYESNEKFRSACAIYRQSINIAPVKKNDDRNPDVVKSKSLFSASKKYSLIFTVVVIVILIWGIIWTILRIGNANKLPTTLIFADDFEANLNNWQGSNTSISPTLVPSGYGNSKFAVEVVGDKATSSIYRPLPGDFSFHNSYKVSVWCKAKARAPCALSWEDRPGYENSAEQTVQGNGEWQPLSICKKLTQNETGNMLVYLHAQTTPEIPVSRVQYDNLQVEQVSQCVRPISTSATLTWTSDFEEDLEIWKKCGDEKDRDVSTLVQPGYNSDHAVQVTYRQPVDGKPVDQSGICRYVYDANPDDPPSFKKGEFYRASVWCKAELGDECWLGFTDLPYNDSGYDNLAGEVIKGNGEWQLVSVCKAIFKDSRMSVHIYAKKRSTHSILYDDLQVEKVDRCP